MPTAKEVADKAAAEKYGSLAGAQAVATAVSRVADAAVAEIAKTSSGPLPEILVSGVSGGRFVIRGEGLGTNGVVTLNGHPAKVLGWGGTRIEGVFPTGIGSGVVVVHIDDKTSKRATVHF